MKFDNKDVFSTKYFMGSRRVGFSFMQDIV